MVPAFAPQLHDASMARLGGRGRRCVMAGLLCLLLPFGCEARAFRRAHRQGTVPAYLRYLLAHPKGGHRRRALEALDDARFLQAARADRPYAYRSYLQAAGTTARHAAEARRRLAELALEGAKDPAALELVLEHHGASPQAAEARRRLATAEAQEVLRLRDEDRAERYLRRYPATPAGQGVRELLGGLLFVKLRDDSSELEAFLQKFAGTSWAPKALERLRRHLRAEVEASRDERTLESFAARFPEDADLPRLRQRVRAEQTAHALARVELATLERLAAAAPKPAVGADLRGTKGRAQPQPSLALLVSECRRRAKDCAALREEARGALPWQPALGPEQLQQQLRDADLQRVWQALAQLGWRPEAQAATALLEEVGSARPSAVWAAAPALRRWLQRAAPRDRVRWLALKLGRPPRRANADEVQRWGYLALLAGHEDRRREGAQYLLRLLNDRERQLVAAHLLLSARPGPAATFGPILAAARRRVDRLVAAFPRHVTKDSLTAAALVEHELFAVAQIVKQAEALRSTSSGARLEQRIRLLLASWRRVLRRADRRFVAARGVDLAAHVAAHDAARSSRLRELLRRRGILPAAVARAVCGSIAVERGAAGQGAGPALRRLCQPLWPRPTKKG